MTVSRDFDNYLPLTLHNILEDLNFYIKLIVVFHLKNSVLMKQNILTLLLPTYTLECSRPTTRQFIVHSLEWLYVFATILCGHNTAYLYLECLHFECKPEHQVPWLFHGFTPFLRHILDNSIRSQQLLSHSFPSLYMFVIPLFDAIKADTVQAVK